MKKIANYQLSEKIYESKISKVYRGVQENDGRPVILKILNKEYPSTEELSLFRREYKIVQKLQDIEGVINAIELLDFQNTLVIVEEDIGGTSLATLLTKMKPDTQQCLKLAIQIADVIDQLHQHNVIHKDINPANIIWNPETHEVKIIDFGISSLLKQEYHEFQNPGKLEGTLAYTSPEQTGRINRVLDYRSDLYSFGVTLYFMFTGSLPFTAKEGIELVHAHIAQMPVDLSNSKTNLPPALSQIILRLLSKMADDRYQSGAGVKYDLERCLTQIENKNSENIFQLGQKDHSPIFLIPQALYGREKEVSLILEAFNRVSQGSIELIMVSGFSGTGKSSLVHEVHLPLTEKRGLYISGKFDQYQTGVPFHAWSVAFEGFVSLLLKEDESSLERWKKNIQSAVGNIGQVISDVVPSIELIIGKQPDIPRLTGEQALNRFNYVFRAFVKSISKKEHPLVVFIDDWQWADAASLNLLNFLMSDKDNAYLLIIGAYRDNEVDSTHSFRLTLDDIERSKANVSTIQLQNLTKKDVFSLVSDALRNPPAIDSLVNLIYEKTQGNAFFLVQFLRNLYNESLIHFDTVSDCWLWDQAEVESKDITDNVVQLMANKIQQLPYDTQETLKFAACIGSRFDLSTLAIIQNKNTRETASRLEKALQKGIIKPLDLNYRFANIEIGKANVTYQFIHDRVQQAAYSLIVQKKRGIVHVNIADTMIDKLNSSDKEKRIFDIVNHYNAGKNEVTTALQKERVASLNISAGKKAKSTTAYTLALHYFKSALELLDNTEWQTQYQQTAELYLIASEVAFLSKQYDQMELWIEIYLKKVKTPLEKSKAYEIRLQAYTAQNRLSDAVDASLYALTLLDIEIPKSPNNFQVLAKLLQTKKALKGKTFGDLFALPPMKDQKKLAAMNLLGLMIPPAYWTSQELVASTVFQMTQESVKYGYSAITGYGYSWWGITQCSMLGNIDSGYEFGEFGVNIAQTHNLPLQQPLFFFGWIIKPFKHHISESIDVLLKSYELSLEKGDFEYASYSLNNYIQVLFHCGNNLGKLVPKMVKANRELESFQVGSSIYWHNIWWQTALNFSVETTCPTTLDGSAYKESESVSQHLKVNDTSTLFLLYCAKLMLSYFYRDYAKGIQYAKKARLYLKGGTGMYALILFHFYESLTILASLEAHPGPFKKLLLFRVNSNQKKLKKWAHHSPENHLHRWNLVHAEQLRIKGKSDKASRFYDMAIDQAKKSQFVHEEALACELATHFFLTRNQKRLAVHYLRQADYLYQQWGAHGKVADLKTSLSDLYPLVSQHSDQLEAGIHTTTKITPSRRHTESLDLTSMMKAAQAISGEIVFDELIKTLLTIVIENAGAQKGILVTTNGAPINIDAIGYVENNNIIVTAALEKNKSQNDLPLPASIIHFVTHKMEAVVIEDASHDARFSQDPYINRETPKSILCLPIIKQRKLSAIIYLENNLTYGAFTPERLQVLQMLTSQAAISIENARLYGQLENKVNERTEKLQSALKAQEKSNELLLKSGDELKDAHTQLHDANLQLQVLANTDGLTQLANRRFFDKRVEYEINRCFRNKQTLSILLCDIDHFKMFNDTYGHVDGDECLKKVASQFEKIFHRATDLPARYGGEEFVVILPASSSDQANEMADNLRTSVASLSIPHKNNTPYGVVTISIGCCSLVPASGMTTQCILEKADEALYQAKSKGRNQVISWKNQVTS